MSDVIDFGPTLWSLIEHRAALTPDRVLIEDEHGRSLTASELRDRAQQVAAGLRAAGVAEGVAVSWQLPTSIEAVLTVCALARLGAVQNPIIPILRRREVGFIVAETGARLLITPTSFRGFDHAAMADDVAGEHGCATMRIDRGSLPAGDPSDLPPPPTGEGDPVRFVYYSSGTTADPKGGRHTDRSAMATANGIVSNMGVRADDCVPIPFPITHIGGMVFLTTALHTGCRLVLVEVFDPATTPERLAAHGPTLLGSAVPFYRAYIDAQRRHGAEPLYPQLRAFIGGGAPKPPEIHAELRDLFGVVGVVAGWGLTECAIATCGSFDDTDEELASTEGRPSPGVEIRVVDAAGEQVRQGEEGELCIRAPQCIVGYVDPTLDVAFDGDGFLHTGDLGIVGPRGHVRITGRLKDVIIRNAENISAQEVEDVLYSHPAVSDVAVIGLPDPLTGERACAVVVVEPGSPAPSLDDLAVYCKAGGLAAQKIPERLVVVDALPRNALGKVVKQELRARYRTD